MKQILKALSFFLVALWIITSSVSAGASVSDTSSAVSMGAHGSQDMMMDSCVMHHQQADITSLSAEADMCGETAANTGCKMLGADHCSNVFSKLVLSDDVLADLTASKIQMQDYRSALIGVSPESITPPPRS